MRTDEQSLIEAYLEKDATIQPGNHRLKINSIELKQWPFMKEKNAYHLILNVETEPIKDFDQIKPFRRKRWHSLDVINS